MPPSGIHFQKGKFKYTTHRWPRGGQFPYWGGRWGGGGDGRSYRPDIRLRHTGYTGLHFCPTGAMERGKLWDPTPPPPPEIEILEISFLPIEVSLLLVTVVTSERLPFLGNGVTLLGLSITLTSIKWKFENFEVILSENSLFVYTLRLQKAQVCKETESCPNNTQYPSSIQISCYKSL